MESRELRGIQAREDPLVRTAQKECWGTEVHQESEEFLGQKETLAFLVQMVVKEFLDCQGPRVFQEKMGLQVMLAHRDFLVCRELMVKKDTEVQRVTQAIQELLV